MVPAEWMMLKLSWIGDPIHQYFIFSPDEYESLEYIFSHLSFGHLHIDDLWSNHQRPWFWPIYDVPIISTMWIIESLSICQTVQTFRTSMFYICGKIQIILSYILTILIVSVFSPWMVCARIQICFICLFILNGVICWFLLLNKTLARSYLSLLMLSPLELQGDKRGKD